MDKVELQRYFRKNRVRFVEEWKEFVRFPSVGADASRQKDCHACAKWLAGRLERMGFRASLVPARNIPPVFAERPGDPGKPTILFYGHYDVQPADPVGEWTTPPFEPCVRGGRLYGRGAQDNKGQVMYALKAFEALGNSGPTIKVIIEGEEENGGADLARALPRLRSRLKADILMVSDSFAAPDGAPAITMGLRGLVNANAVLRGPRRDLHSGTHGGLAPNPATGMAQLVAGLHNRDGSVAVRGFYDGVKAPSGAIRRLARVDRFSAGDYRKKTGVAPVGGEKKYGPVERASFRPTLEVNGMHSGYGGTGTKTIIPSYAMVKLTARLVPGQDPAKCLAAIKRHLADNVPAGLELEIVESGIAGPAFATDINSPVVARSARVLKRLFGVEPAYVWEGASVPVIPRLVAASGAQPLLVGFGQEEDNIHAVDESFSFAQFEKGFLYVASFLSDL